MFEKTKYEKMKKAETQNGYSELKVILPLSVDKSCYKNLTAKIKECFGNFKVEKSNFYEIYSLAEEYPMELRLGEIMDCIAQCKTDGEIEFFVNEQSYKI